MNLIGNYEILRTISEKGQNRVYEARHTVLDRKTLLKVYLGGDDLLIQRFEREARIVADLNDDSIVSVYDFGKVDGQFYISMEYVEGCSLAEYMANDKPDAKDIIGIASKITRGLAVIHSKGYIHRDLKPENILIDKNMNINLTDFGISIHESANRITEEGSLIGTPLYLSPEQINNLPVIFSADMFALGTILYQLATGTHPFEAPQYGEIFSKILSYDPPPVNTINPSLPEWFSESIGLLISKDPDNRPPDARKYALLLDKMNPEINQLRVPYDSKSKKVRSMTLFFIVPAVILGIIFIIYLRSIYSPAGNPDIPQPAFTDSVLFAENSGPALNEIELKPDEIISTKKVKSVSKEKNLPSKTDYEPDQSIKIIEPTTLLINTWPWAKVYIDYREIDVTPMSEPIKFNPGKYLVSLQHPLYPSWSDSITVKKGINNLFIFNLDSLFIRLDLQINPWGEVYIDGQYRGTSPLADPIYLTRENHSVTIKNKYYITHRDSVIWNGDHKIVKNIMLREIPPPN
ncbi:MAG: serine/threonine protein kinase [Calditrichaceae bacterium]